MTKRKATILAASSLGVFLVAALTVGVVYKWNKTNEYNEYLEQQTKQAELEKENASSSNVEPENIESIKIPEIKANNKEDVQSAASSVPEVVVSTDENGNQTITPVWTKPQPTEEELTNPNSKPGTSSSKPETASSKPETPSSGSKDTSSSDKDKQKDTSSTGKPNNSSSSGNDGAQYDNDGNQVPNENGEVYVPGFGWVPQASGGKSIPIHNAGTGDVIGY